MQPFMVIARSPCLPPGLPLSLLSCLCMLACCACPGCVFRTAAPIHASELDTKKLYNDLGIKDLVRTAAVAAATCGCWRQQQHLRLTLQCFEGPAVQPFTRAAFVTMRHRGRPSTVLLRRMQLLHHNKYNAHTKYDAHLRCRIWCRACCCCARRSTCAAARR